MSYHTNLTIVHHHPSSLPVIVPISRGPYAGNDFIYIENDLRGQWDVKRMTQGGELVKDYGKVKNREEGFALACELLFQQSEKDINAVTGGGRWGCD